MCRQPLTSSQRHRPTSLLYLNRWVNATTKLGMKDGDELGALRGAINGLRPLLRSCCFIIIVTQGGNMIAKAARKLSDSFIALLRFPIHQNHHALTAYLRKTMQLLSVLQLSCFFKQSQFSDGYLLCFFYIMKQ